MYTLGKRATASEHLKVKLLPLVANLSKSETTLYRSCVTLTGVVANTIDIRVFSTIYANTINVFSVTIFIAYCLHRHHVNT